MSSKNKLRRVEAQRGGAQGKGALSSGLPVLSRLQIMLGIYLASTISIYVLLRMMFPEIFTPGTIGIANSDFYLLRTIRVLLILLWLLLGMIIVWHLRKERLVNYVLTLWVCSLIFGIFEIGLMYYSKSDSVGVTFAHMLHIRKYPAQVAQQDTFSIPFTNNGQVRSLPYILRKNPFPQNFCQKGKILFIGDSFTYGDGIDDWQDTYPAVFGSGDNQVDAINLGVRGIDPAKELLVFLEYKRRAGLFGCNNLKGIVWQFCFNDVEPSAEALGLSTVFHDNPLIENVFGLFQNSSLTGNFLYWELKRKSQSSDEGYKTFLKEAYKNPKIVEQAILPIVTTAKTAPLVMLIFPVLNTDMAFSDTLYTELYRQLDMNHVRYLKVSDIKGVREMPVLERIVSAENPHPSVKLCRKVGEGLREYLTH